MFTGQQISGTGGSSFDGNIVIFENRPFGIRCRQRPERARGIRHPGVPGRRRDGRRGDLRPRRQHRTAGRLRDAVPTATVLLRWYASQARPRRPARRLDRRRDLRAPAARRVQPAERRPAGFVTGNPPTGHPQSVQQLRMGQPPGRSAATGTRSRRSRRRSTIRTRPATPRHALDGRVCRSDAAVADAPLRRRHADGRRRQRRRT